MVGQICTRSRCVDRTMQYKVMLCSPRLCITVQGCVMHEVAGSAAVQGVSTVASGGMAGEAPSTATFCTN